MSDWTDIKAGVQHGSILGPLLCLLYINDIVEDIHSSIKLFADDTNLYIIVDNPVQAADQLNSDITKIHQWANKWLVTFNPTKSESIIFSRKRIKPHHPPVLINNIQINEVSAHKHLGVIFSNIYILGVFTEKPFSKPLECNIVYIPIISLSHATSHDFK